MHTSLNICRDTQKKTADKTQTPSKIDFTPEKALRHLGPLPMTRRDAAKEKALESLWESYFHDNGRGLCMYRMQEGIDHAQRGLPERYRAELWLLYSGALDEVGGAVGGAGDGGRGGGVSYSVMLQHWDIMSFNGINSRRSAKDVLSVFLLPETLFRRSAMDCTLCQLIAC